MAFFRRFNMLVVASVVLLAVVMGVANNLRVYEEQRVPWFGTAQEDAND